VANQHVIKPDDTITPLRALDNLDIPNFPARLRNLLALSGMYIYFYVPATIPLFLEECNALLSARKFPGEGCLTLVHRYLLPAAAITFTLHYACYSSPSITTTISFSILHSFTTTNLLHLLSSSQSALLSAD
jgi:hypothetical protein